MSMLYKQVQLGIVMFFFTCNSYNKNTFINLQIDKNNTETLILFIYLLLIIFWNYIYNIARCYRYIFFIKFILNPKNPIKPWVFLKKPNKTLGFLKNPAGSIFFEKTQGFFQP